MPDADLPAVVQGTPLSPCSLHHTTSFVACAQGLRPTSAPSTPCPFIASWALV